MPFPGFVNFRSELDPTTRKELDEMSASMTEWLSKEHNSDGTHGDISATSITVSTFVKVYGANGTDVVLLGAHHPSNETVLSTLSNQPISSLVTFENMNATVGSRSNLDLLAGSTQLRMSANNGLTTEIGSISNHSFGIQTNNVVRALFAATGDFAINTNKFTLEWATGNAVVAGTLALTGDFAINANKFTVTASNGNTAVAGTLGVTGATTLSGQLAVNLANAAGATVTTATTGTNASYDTWTNTGGRVFVGRDNSAGTAIGTAGRAYAGSLWVESNHDMQFGTNNTERMSITNAGAVTVEQTFRTKGAVRFDTFVSKALTTDGSGNIVGITGASFGPNPVASITVVNGIITNIS